MILKIIFDKAVSFIGLLILWPVLLVVALLIKWKMPGPILFCQQRVGRYGEIFTVYKFRTMTVKREAAVASRGSEATSIASQEQSRITPLGEKLRRYKLDELPELWNVLKGDMSFVGPRPDVPGYADQLQDEDREVLLLRPGITGPASLKYRNEEDILQAIDEALQKGGEGLPAGVTTVQEYNDNIIYPDKVRLNRYYLHHYSFMKDIQMIVCTVLGKRMEYAGEQI